MDLKFKVRNKAFKASGGPDWTRTNDFHHVKVTLYQLSYGAKKKRQYIKKISQ